MAKLVVITKGMPAASHELGDNWVTIGRADGNSFQIVETSVSGRHCEVRVKGDELVVRDLLSTNGTFAGGKKITEAVVKAGETFSVGEVDLRFEASAPANSPGSSFVTKMLVTNLAAKTPAPATANSSKPAADAKPASQPETNGTRKHRVLFVDDSMAFLEMFCELSEVLSKGTWEIQSATTADRALAILQEGPIDLVVLDIGIPMVDGIQLLGIISRRYPGIKIAVMTGNASETKRAASLAGGAELFIEKPVSADGIKVVFNMLNDLAAWIHREGFTGTLRQVGLQEVIQMECIGRHSSILEIHNPQLHGQIYIENGAIIHATVGTLLGDHAFYKLLSLKGGEFQLKPFQPPQQRTVQERWEFLIMDAARASDEETALLAKQSALTPAAGPPEPKTPPPPQTGHAALGKDIIVVATYDDDGKWKPADHPQK
jgi:CheY-like chemotaxis protein